MHRKATVKQIKKSIKEVPCAMNKNRSFHPILDHFYEQ